MDGSCSDDVINLGPLDDLNRAPTAGTAPFDFLPIQGGGRKKQPAQLVSETLSSFALST